MGTHNTVYKRRLGGKVMLNDREALYLYKKSHLLRMKADKYFKKALKNN